MNHLVARNSTSIDPKDDINNPLRYIASNTWTTVAVVLFGVSALSLTWRLFSGRWRARYMLATVIGSFTITLGFAVRYVLHTHPDSKGVYIAEDLLIVLSPCAFIASNYTLLGRLTRHTMTGRYVLVRPNRLTILFVSSDITTFLIQAAGGSMSVSTKSSTVKLGNTLFKIGIIAQLVSFCFFTFTLFLWFLRVRMASPQVWKMSTMYAADGVPLGGAHSYSWRRDWRTLATALCISCSCIIVRCVYRTIEALQGYHGSLATNEHTFYGLDSLPLWIAITVYVIFWPGNYIDFDRLSPTGMEGDMFSGSGNSHELKP